jgi:hypothetical protein
MRHPARNARPAVQLWTGLDCCCKFAAHYSHPPLTQLLLWLLWRRLERGLKHVVVCMSAKELAEEAHLQADTPAEATLLSWQAGCCWRFNKATATESHTITAAWWCSSSICCAFEYCCHHVPASKSMPCEL